MMEQPPEKTERKEYSRREIEELEAPMRRIISALREDIEAGTFELLIGDDASGRIPTLILDRFLRRRYGDLGYTAPRTKFVAGSGSGTGSISGADAKQKSAVLDDFVRGLDVPAGKRVLIVTDVVLSGMSLEPLMRALHEHRIAFDVATVGMDESYSGATRDRIEAGYGARLISGSHNIYPGVFGRHDLAGVVKDKTDLHAHPYRSSEETKGWRKRFARRSVQRTINETRDDIDRLADALAETYEASPA